MSGIIGGAGSRSGVIGTTELDYEEGIWTPNDFSGFDASGEPSSITTSYTKVGNMVSVRGTFSAYNDSTSVNFAGLPYAVSGASSCSVSVNDTSAVSGEYVLYSKFYFTVPTHGSSATWYFEATYRTA